ncbi:hypothetical protein [Candidatus Protofrankia californiensis]|uniref:hypothetical protein n=1 Tax=Candidatus Protofrankia californiensis TaxID=1839754 RepID=UPI001041945D|nr:hypothetical protein [Candidatus Protofrankia californiensis]
MLDHAVRAVLTVALRDPLDGRGPSLSVREAIWHLIGQMDALRATADAVIASLPPGFQADIGDI